MSRSPSLHDPTAAHAEPGSALAPFQPATRAWFSSTFAAPTLVQAKAWQTIASGRNALVVAPTGSGKTLAAFLWAIDRLSLRAPRTVETLGVRVVYVSPLKALAVDVERNLRAPLAGIRAAAERLGLPPPAIAIGLRSGDTPARDRRRFGLDPPDVLITTPESLYLLLTSSAREALRTVDTVIVDEVHAVAGGKRGAHLALGLERLDRLLDAPAQRIGLSATVRPLDEVARFLGGAAPVEVVDARVEKPLEVSVVVPLDDMTALGGRSDVPSGAAPGKAPPPSIWPHVEANVLELVRAHRSTIIFANSRRLAERLCARLNELAGEEIARAHHGSVAREQRAQIEEALKAGRLPAVVATSSLELGIDMGAVDLVVQIEAPDSVASGLQRVGRAGHQVGGRSRGVIFPKFRGDLLESAIVAERMQQGAIEALRYPRNPLDVLAQQITAMVVMDDWTVDELERTVRRAAPFAELPRAALESVLDMLAGRHPSDAFADLRPRLVWDRVSGRLTARAGARTVALTSGGTIPDRGLFGVFLVGERGSRVGELDEEMVYESRVGEVFVLGASSWRIEDITADRVLVSPAPGQPGKMPFWHGDAPGRPVELGRALGAFVRELADARDGGAARRLEAAGLDARAAGNLLAYLDEQRVATGVLPDDRTIVLERFRDELGDWRLCIHSFFGARVHAPWAQAIAARVRGRFGVDLQMIYGDDGIVLRVPEGEDAAAAAALVFDADDVEDLVVGEVGRSALFASRFRECAARALLIPKRRPGRRSPLWLQRQRAAALLQVARRHPSFAIVLETYRECLQDVFDLPALIELLAAIRSRAVRVVEVESEAPSPFARSLQLEYVRAFMYEGDAPLAERRAQALTLDRALLAELMGREELRELLDAGALAELESRIGRLADDRKAHDLDGTHDLLRTLGDLAEPEVAARHRDPAAVPALLAALEREHRALPVRIAGEERWIAAEDAGRYRDALGTALPAGVPPAFLEPVPDALAELVARHARTHGPFGAADVAARFAIGTAVAERALRALERAGRVLEGEFRPGASGRERIDVEVLRRLRSRSLAALRREVAPAPPDALARVTLAWHRIGGAGPRATGVEALWRVIEQLQGVPVPASALETQILRARLPAYGPALLDQLGAAGEIVWAGAGALGASDGWIVLALTEQAPFLLPEAIDVELSPLAIRLLEVFGHAGALFFRQLAESVDAADDGELLLALWELVWAGRVTNDTFAPLRALLRHRPRKAESPSRRRRRGRERPLSAIDAAALQGSLAVPLLGRALAGAAPTAAPDAGAPAGPIAGSARGIATELAPFAAGSRRAPADAVPGPSPGGARGDRSARIAPPAAAGRWSLTIARAADPTRRAHAWAMQLLRRHGIVTRGALAAERVPGGFTGVYPVLRAFEESGRCRRGYFVEGLGGAQFALPGAVDRMRALADDASAAAVVLAATDPANPYGAALPWPDRDAGDGHRAGRKAGAAVVLVGGSLVLYVERGGHTLLSYRDEPAVLRAAIDALAQAARDRVVGRLELERADGRAVRDTPLAAPLLAAGFHPTWRGLELRG